MDTPRLTHLWTAGLEMAHVCPEVSRTLISQLHETAGAAGVTLGRSTAEAACRVCGAISIGPGVRTAHRRSSHGSPGGTVLRTRCTTCATVLRRNVGKRKNLSAAIKPQATSAVPRQPCAVAIASKPGQKKAKKKRKKKGGSTTPTTDNTPASFSLTDFLSTL